MNGPQNHKERVDHLLMGGLFGELSPEESRELDLLLASDEALRTEFQQNRNLLGALSQLPQAEVPQAALDNVLRESRLHLDRVKNAQGLSWWASLWREFRPAIAMSAAAAVTLVVGYYAVENIVPDDRAGSRQRMEQELRPKETKVASGTKFEELADSEPVMAPGAAKSPARPPEPASPATANADEELAGRRMAVALDRTDDSGDGERRAKANASYVGSHGHREGQAAPMARVPAALDQAPEAAEQKPTPATPVEEAYAAAEEESAARPPAPARARRDSEPAPLSKGEATKSVVGGAGGGGARAEGYGAGVGGGASVGTGNRGVATGADRMRSEQKRKKSASDGPDRQDDYLGVMAREDSQRPSTVPTTEAEPEGQYQTTGSSQTDAKKSEREVAPQQQAPTEMAKEEAKSDDDIAAVQTNKPAGTDQPQSTSVAEKSQEVQRVEEPAVQASNESPASPSGAAPSDNNVLADMEKATGGAAPGPSDASEPDCQALFKKVQSFLASAQFKDAATTLAKLEGLPCASTVPVAQRRLAKAKIDMGTGEKARAKARLQELADEPDTATEAQELLEELK